MSIWHDKASDRVDLVRCVGTAHGDVLPLSPLDFIYAHPSLRVTYQNDRLLVQDSYL
jgi:hypothetical protein